ncbi:sodium:dicarboxylate symporter [Solibacillus sp. R5-41]|uniref:YesK family protein n=1 Tax=Solibacillus sp. R5-41 TaxID=2048654 RepID=UPI000C127614|nr:YesK family protein [Solibacillus sp. R5-41]ATP40771.1 sodium:dicarboxylate symporter [Solibacillus sp. R5-41]
MNALMLEGWTPILLIGIMFIVVVFLISRKVTVEVLYLISSILSVICIGVVIYSITAVGGWDGIGLGFVTISIFIGIWIGTVIGVASKK